MSRATPFALLSVLATAAVAPFAACYRPRIADCVATCDAARICPDGMTCAAGLCTHGRTCALAVAAGARHTCAIRGPAVTCWGNNAYGQIGAGGPPAGAETGLRPSPVELGAGAAATALAAGGRHTCAVLAGDGANVACWGDDSHGQLGSGGGPSNPGPGTPPTMTITSFGSGHRILSIAAGVNHTCVVDGTGGGAAAAGAVRCWGDARLGQLGRAATADGTAAAAAALPGVVDLGGARAVEVSAGAYHTCARLEDGRIACWGWNDYGQLGPGNSGVAPGAIATVQVPGGFDAVAAGAYQTCAIYERGSVTCWGDNAAGQLGVAPTVQPDAALAPVDLGPGRTAISISVGAAHACALLDDFSVKCWGLNLEGELGLGDTQNRGGDGRLGDALPPVGLGGDPVSMISAGASHTCAIQGPDVKCWGSNQSGRLGVAGTHNRGDDPSHPIAAISFAK